MNMLDNSLLVDRDPPQLRDEPDPMEAYREQRDFGSELFALAAGNAREQFGAPLQVPVLVTPELLSALSSAAGFLQGHGSESTYVQLHALEVQLRCALASARRAA